MELGAAVGCVRPARRWGALRGSGWGWKQGGKQSQEAVRRGEGWPQVGRGELSRRGDQPLHHQQSSWVWHQDVPGGEGLGVCPVVSSQVVLGRAMPGAAQAPLAVNTDSCTQRGKHPLLQAQLSETHIGLRKPLEDSSPSHSLTATMRGILGPFWPICEMTITFNAA